MDKCWCGNKTLLPFSPNYSKCSVCGTLVSKAEFPNEKEIVSNAKENKKSLYGEEYWTQKMLKTAKCNSLDDLFTFYIKTRAEYWLHSILRYRLGASSVCEVGCGLGQLSYLMNLAGFHVFPMELNAEICRWITNQTGINVTCGDISQFKEKMDILIANDVLEHIPDPQEFLKTVSFKLAENGIIFIQTPCYDGVSAYEEMTERNDRFLLLMEENEHVFLYSRDSVCELFRRFEFSCSFLPAYFGDDYDMYFVASVHQQREYSDEEIRQYLYKLPAGRLLSSAMEMEADIRKSGERISAMQQDIDYLNSEAQKANKALAEKQAENDEMKKTYNEHWLNRISWHDRCEILNSLALDSDKVNRRRIITLLSRQKAEECAQFSSEDWIILRTALNNYISITEVLLNAVEG